ncbi:hypothetical protein GCM10023149_48650 [Mucilaginibacter gynuensis]|uniref:Insertion element HTH domain-containing protein n=1 Tax=Mucilaginibacter gynuensis TaxID=1302236 RepID=A0ABP8HFA6_9SPHI
MSKQRERTLVLKKAMIAALEKSMGIVTSAAKAVGIERKTHYLWLEKDAKYKAEVDAITDVALDFAETKLMASIASGSDTATIFFLKTKGKKRGYIEKVQTDITTNGESLNKGLAAKSTEELIAMAKELADKLK